MNSKSKTPNVDLLLKKNGIKPPPTKNQVLAFIRNRGCKAVYSGHTHTIYITGPNHENVELATLKEFHGMPFKTQSSASRAGEGGF